MAGVEALGLACNVMQIISFAHETIVFCRDVYQGSSPDSELHYNAQSLASLSKDIRNDNQAARPPTASQKRLSDIAEKCMSAARSLDEEIHFLIGHHAKGDLVATIRIAANSNWRKRRLDRLEKNLRDYQSTLDSYLLARLCKQSTAIELQRRSEFDKLDKHVQQLVKDVGSGHSQITDLFHSTAEAIKSHNTQESKRTEKELANHVTNTVSEAQTVIENHISSTVKTAAERIGHAGQAARQQTLSSQERRDFLQSLKFSGMNERKSRLSESHKGTFAWIFYPENQEQSSFEESDDEYSVDYSSDSCTSYSGEEPLRYDSPANTSGEPSGETQAGDCIDPGSDSENPDEEGYITEDFEGESLASSPIVSTTSDAEDEPWDSFVDWLRSESRIYWISGKPGSGKSTLVKFLVDNRLTKKALETWSQGTVVLSHFFWKPGSLLQRSIRGSLLSLLHQLLSKDSTILDTVLTKNASESLSSKSENTDWSDKELEKLLFQVLEKYSSCLCIFLDGLDEICQEDGATRILHLVDRLRAMSNVKVCVASRPEPSLKSKLAVFQHLRLQDLTVRDMIDYAQATLQPFWGGSQISPRRQRIVLKRLLSKAQGVFLWLSLALRHLQTGITNGDSCEDLLQRLQELPPELNELYWDMWKRLNENTKVYREDTARYFNLLIDAQNIPQEIKITRWGTTPVFNSNMCLLDMMAATDLETQKTMLGKRINIDTTKMPLHWNKAWEAIKTKCAGIIDLSQTLTSDGIAKRYKGSDEELRRSLPLMLSNLVFIHRTAYDFLTDTEHGKHIRSFDSSSPGCRRLKLVKGALARLRLILERREHELKIWQVIFALAQIDELELNEEIKDVLRICWSCYREIRRHRSAHWKTSPADFMTLAAFPKPLFHEFVMDLVRKSRNPQKIATKVLRNIHSTWNFHALTSNFEHGARGTVERLIALGADINSKGILMPPEPEDWDKGFASYVSAFGSFVKEAVASDKIDVEYLWKCLPLFLEKKPDLDHRLSLVLSTYETESGIYDVSLGVQVGNLDFGFLCPYNNCFVLDVNLSFLLQILLRRIGASSIDEVRKSDTKMVLPHASIVFFIQGPAYAVMEEQRSDDALRMFMPWLCSRTRKDFIPAEKWFFMYQMLRWKPQGDPESEPDTFLQYRDGLLSYLADDGCEFIMVKDN